MAAHTSEISLLIELDENRVPEKINWTAPDSGVDHSETKATMLSVWDEKAQETLRIDLWTKEMPVDQMKKYVHQSLLARADTLEKAANEGERARELRDYAVEMGEKLGVLRR